MDKEYRAEKEKFREQNEEAKAKAGRYQLGEAAQFIADKSNENVNSMMQMLFNEARDSGLTVYEPGTNVPYQFSTSQNLDNEVWLEAYWDDLNKWLKNNLPRLDCKFPDPDAPAAKVKAGTSPGYDWAEEARAIADRLALERYQRGEREITARNISDAVAIELAKDTTTHGIRGERVAGSIRNGALKGWKFIPPTGTNGTSGTKK